MNYVNLCGHAIDSGSQMFSVRAHLEDIGKDILRRCDSVLGLVMKPQPPCPRGGHDPQVENHCHRQSKLNISHSNYTIRPVL